MIREVLAEQFVFRFIKNVKNLDRFRSGKRGEIGGQFFI